VSGAVLDGQELQSPAPRSASPCPKTHKPPPQDLQAPAPRPFVRHASPAMSPAYTAACLHHLHFAPGYAVRALHSLESGGGVGNSALDKADLAKLRQVKAADDESPPLAEAAKLDAERRERLAGSLRTVAGLGDFLEGFLQDK